MNKSDKREERTTNQEEGGKKFNERLQLAIESEPEIQHEIIGCSFDSADCCDDDQGKSYLSDL